MAGKEMYAYIRDGELRQVDVTGNAETVFFPQDEKTGDWMGVNKTQSSFVKLFIKDEKVERVLFTTATTGTMYPIDQLSENETHLSLFFWADDLRPRKPGDVFLKPQEVSRPEGEAAADETPVPPAGEGLRAPDNTPPPAPSAGERGKLKKKK